MTPLAHLETVDDPAAEPGSPARSSGLVTPFVLASRDGTLVGHGAAQVLSCRGRRDLSSCISSFFANLSAAGQSGALTGTSMLVGALPFSSSERAHLFQPLRVEHLPPGAAVLLSPAARPADNHVQPPTAWSVRAEPSRGEYARRVRQVLTRMGTANGASPSLSKVVLGRRLILQAHEAIDVAAVLARLATDPDSTTFAVPLPPGRDGRRRALVGATPELLLEKSGGLVRSEPMAGSARRVADPRADREVAERLLRSEKDRREHAAVVDWVVDRLTPYCRTLRVPDGPTLRSTSTMWHLVTPVEGELHDASTSSIELTLALHPTPAVCGVPREAAARAIDELESFDRGFFTGAVGWCDARGDGRWLVTIRCGEISGNVASLYAGAGIVAGSDPDAEGAETSAKFATLLRALGVDEDGQVVAESDR